MPLRLLLHTCDPQLQSVLSQALSGDFSVFTVSGAARAEEMASEGKCDVVIADLQSCPGRKEFALVDALRAQAVPVVALTENDRESMLELVHRSVLHYCHKPVHVPELTLMIRRAYDHSRLQQEIGDSRPVPAGASGCGEMVGAGAGSRAVYDRIRRVANLNTFVLITGESGTGKELIARAVHSVSNRAACPFVAVSCGAIPESLIEAELFGCEKGAFTGALARRAGYLEGAGAGTLLLDEIGELSHHMQVKLLRVLQQREFMRLGSHAVVPLRARVLFATNRNLKRMVDQGTFREDLYYRINVIGIHSPPLRDRVEEIPQLARHFLTRYARSYGKPVLHIAPDALDLLRRYAWPGNVRELENVMQSAIILTDDEQIRVSNLPQDLQEEALREEALQEGALREEALREAERQRSGGAGLDDDRRWASFEDQLRDYKTRLAIEAVEECNGNKTLAAQSLGISRTYLHRLIRDPGENGPALRVA